MQHALLGLTAETSLHAGTGRSTGVIDLPIMREAHTGWPCVYGSAVKGALRGLAQQQNASGIHDIFGPDTQNASDHAGALAVGDARLLLLPVRSLSSHFKWVTCPALLRRAAADAQRLGITDAVNPDLSLTDNTVIVPQAAQKALFLEEFSFEQKAQDLSALIAWLARFGDEGFAQRLQAQLAIISDDMFSHLANFATPVTPHIAIDNARKAVKPGALWYEETLPPESVLYLTLAASASRRKDGKMLASEVLHSALQLFPPARPYVQLGGNETVGMGWCRVQSVFCSVKA
jgi:CRISPR-associated protein Cmr4